MFTCVCHVHMQFFLLYLSSLLWFTLHNHINNMQLPAFRFLMRECFFLHMCRWLHTRLTPPNVPRYRCIFSEVHIYFMHRILHITAYIRGAYIFCITNITPFTMFICLVSNCLYKLVSAPWIWCSHRLYKLFEMGKLCNILSAFVSKICGGFNSL